MWNNLRTQEALEGGVFSRTAFLKVGTEDDPCPYDTKEPERDSYRGKQFSTQATRTGKLPKDFLDGSFKPLFEGEPYVDRLPYHELQPEQPGKGFMTSDFSKRDEFSMTLRAEQHRQQIKHENRVQKLAADKLAARWRQGADAAQHAAVGAQQAPKREVPLLFDLVYGGEAELCIKAKRDTRNPTALSKERKVGPYRTTNSITQATVVQATCKAASAPAAPTAAAAGSSPQQAGASPSAADKASS